MKPLRVAVDANPATRALATGTEVYTRELCRRLPLAAPEVDFRFYASVQAGSGIPLEVIRLPRLWSQARLPVALASTLPDLFFAPGHVVPFATPVPALTVVHDLAFERFPHAYRARDRAYLRLTTHWAERRCRRLVAVSEATRSDLAELHGVDPARVDVVHPGGGEAPAGEPAPPARLRELGVPDRFVLHVGRVEPRKNQLAALEAARGAGLRLVCAGTAVDRGLAGRLEDGGALLLGRVSDPDLERLYLSARALVFPSLYEGFGFPILEAMRRGLPVVTARVSSLPEVGGDAALYAQDPLDGAELAALVSRLDADEELRARLRSAGAARAAAFSWDASASGVAGVIRRLLAG